MAPSNDAFDSLLAGLAGYGNSITKDTFLKFPELKDIILHHILPGLWTSEYLLNDTSILTAKAIDLTPFNDPSTTGNGGTKYLVAPFLFPHTLVLFNIPVVCHPAHNCSMRFQHPGRSFLPVSKPLYPVGAKVFSACVEGKLMLHDSCIDKPTPDDYECIQQVEFGKCYDPFMISPLGAQWRGGFCEKTCQRCSCDEDEGTFCAEVKITRAAVCNKYSCNGSVPTGDSFLLTDIGGVCGGDYILCCVFAGLSS